MDSVGHGFHGPILLSNPGPDRRPHFARYLPVQPTDGVGGSGGRQRQSGHVKKGSAAIVVSPEIEEAAGVSVKIAPPVREVILNHLEWKSIVSCRKGCVSSEDGGLSHLLEGGCETLAALEQFAHPLEDYEGGMTFVQVPSLGLETERAQSTDSPDAQNNFLPKSYLAIAAIESRRQLSFRGCVFLQIRIQQVKLYTTYLHAPDGDHHHTAANRHSDEPRLPFGAQLASERSVMPIELLVYLLLPA